MARSAKVTEYIAKQPTWQQNHLTLFRDLIHEVDGDIMEDIKWHVPVFLVKGKTLMAMSTFTLHTKYNFFNGSSLENQQLFNNGLDSKISRGIDLHEGESINREALRRVIEESLSKAKESA